MTNHYNTKIWDETPSDNPFYAEECYCHGYDVFGDILPNGQYLDYLFVIYTGEKPTKTQAKLFEILLIAIANPGLRDLSVRAAMNAGVGGSRTAAGLMAALAVGAGQYTGAHEVRLAMELQLKAQKDNFTSSSWKALFEAKPDPAEIDVWLDPEHIPGFDPHVQTMPKPCRQLLALAAEIAGSNSLCSWIQTNAPWLEKQVGYSLGMTGICAGILNDLGISPAMAEPLYLIARLPGAAVHGLEARENGFKQFPFYTDAIALNPAADPGVSSAKVLSNIQPK